MTKDEYDNFRLRYKSCGACFPIYSELSRFEKMWFTAIQKDVAELEETITNLKEQVQSQVEATIELDKENTELSMKRKAERKIFQGIVEKKNDQLAQAKK